MTMENGETQYNHSASQLLESHPALGPDSSITDWKSIIIQILREKRESSCVESSEDVRL